MPNKKYTEGTIYIDFSETTIADNPSEKDNVIENLIESLRSEDSQFNTDDYPYEDSLDFSDFYMDFTASQNTSFEEKIRELLNPTKQPTEFSTLLQSIPNLKIDLTYKEETNLLIKTDQYGKTIILKEN